MRELQAKEIDLVIGAGIIYLGGYRIDTHGSNNSSNWSWQPIAVNGSGSSTAGSSHF
ncbi:MAG: hypothetical protein K2P99_04105 [Burkholderiales bacterium]|nr:hypothetical protein [Burkholderiales bacterium]